MAMLSSRLALTGATVAGLLVVVGLMDAAFMGLLQGFAPGIALAAVAVLAAAGWWLMGRVLGQQQVLADALQRLAKGETDVRLKPGQAPSVVIEGLAGVAAALNGQRQALTSAVPVVGDFAGQLRIVADDCRTALESTATGTAEAETAVRELVQAVQEVAHSAVAAADSTHQAAKESDTGKVTMTEAMGAMSSLGDQIGRASEAVTRLGKETQSIGAVLDVIRGIAEQTNLLALNAAIEAARAGEQGRGFAVVADEVRTLASRTQGSTREIQKMIERLQAEAQGAVEVMREGTSQAGVVEELIENACVSLAEIGGAVSDIDGMTTQIASAAEQQHAAVQSIHGMLSVRGTRGAALQKVLEDLADVSDGLDALRARLG
ncbi:MAG: methyl-accepting chemotaxis protein [Thiohalobacteraceae bacterium]